MIQAGTANIRDCSELEGANYQSIRSAELLMKYYEPERPQAPREVKYVNSTLVPAGTYILGNKLHWDGYDAHKAIYINQAVCNISWPQLMQHLSSCPHRVGHGRQALFDTVYLWGCDTAEKIQLRKMGIHCP